MNDGLLPVVASERTRFDTNGAFPLAAVAAHEQLVGAQSCGARVAQQALVALRAFGRDAQA
jgi:hypothetical protein